jgi:transcription elongation GreA/GreB family factor
MRCAVVVAGCLLVSMHAWGGTQASGTGSSARAVSSTNVKVAKSQAEVDRLQKDVGQQESANRDAAEHLQQQDRTIAQLRERLKAAQEASKRPADGH